MHTISFEIYCKLGHFFEILIYNQISESGLSFENLVLQCSGFVNFNFELEK
jgi:hypothetical protein